MMRVSQRHCREIFEVKLATTLTFLGAPLFEGKVMAFCAAQSPRKCAIVMGMTKELEEKMPNST